MTLYGRYLLQITSFVKNGKQVDFTILKNMQQIVLLMVSIKSDEILDLLQKKICRFSLTDVDEKVTWLVELYFMRSLLRYLAINKVAVQAGKISGFDSFTIRNVKGKIILRPVSKETPLFKLPVMRIKYVDIPILGISSMVCSVLPDTALFSLGFLLGGKISGLLAGTALGEA